MNVTLIGHTLGKRADISANVYNLLDKSIRSPAVPKILRTHSCKTAPPSESLTYRFNSDSGAAK
ncbi:MAG: hypothetical protein WA581_14775 [Candidatus Acidiferrales bacterium]